MKIRSRYLLGITKIQRYVYRSYKAYTLLVSCLKELILLSSFRLSGTKFRILGLRFDMLSEPC